MDPGDTEPDAYLEMHKQRNGDVQHRRLPLFFKQAQQFATRYARRPFVHLPYSLFAEE